MEDYILIPNTDTRIYEGTIVIIQRLPTTKWIVHHGYYTYNGITQEGWYLAAIPSQTVMPLVDSDLYGIVIVDPKVYPRPWPPMPPIPPRPPIPPTPPGPGPGPDVVPFTKEDKATLDKTMITVQDLQERDLLSSDTLINGRVVRVNDYEGHIEYFEWDAPNLTWKLLDYGSRVALKDEIAETYVTKQHLEDNYYTKNYIDSTFATRAYVDETFATKDQVAETYTTKEEVAETYTTKEEVSETYTTKEEVAENYTTKEEVAETYATTEVVETVAESVTTLKEEITVQITEIKGELEWLELQI